MKSKAEQKPGVSPVQVHKLATTVRVESWQQESELLGPKGEENIALESSKQID